MGKKSRSKRNREKATSSPLSGEASSVNAETKTSKLSQESSDASQAPAVPAPNKSREPALPVGTGITEPSQQILAPQAESLANESGLEPDSSDPAKKDPPKRKRKKSSRSVKKDIQAATEAELVSAMEATPPFVQPSPVRELPPSTQEREDLPQETFVSEPISARETVVSEPVQVETPLQQTASPETQPETVTSVASVVATEPILTFPSASPLLRLCAFAYDLLFLFMVNLAIFSFAGFRFIHRFMKPVVETNTFEPQEAKLYFALAVGISFIVSWMYFALSESVLGQGTIGKRIFYLRTSDLAGERISFLRSNLRVLGKLVSCATLGIGFMLSLFRPDRRALHDIIAETRVLKS